MKMAQAVSALAALAHAGRLTIFRELVPAGPQGLAAGEIGRRVGVQPTTLSASLAVLAHAGLVTSRRKGRSVIYSAAYDTMGEVLGFLVQDCCNGSPEVCIRLADVLENVACCPPAMPKPGLA
jgi:ArsR family transcriptional regulator